MKNRMHFVATHGFSVVSAATGSLPATQAYLLALSHVRHLEVYAGLYMRLAPEVQIILTECRRKLFLSINVNFTEERDKLQAIFFQKVGFFQFFKS